MHGIKDWSSHVIKPRKHVCTCVLTDMAGPVEVTTYCRKARRKNDGIVDRAIRLKFENQFDWRSAYGDGPVSTDDSVTRLSDRK